jgi:uncharacterized protein (TIGR03437 family)
MMAMTSYVNEQATALSAPRKGSRAGFILTIGALVIALGISVFARQGQTGQVATISAADFQPKIAPNAIVATYGSNLATDTKIADTSPLPTTLTGTTVTIKDAQGRDLPSPLLFVSPGQINHLIPAGAAPGLAQITVRAGNGAVSIGVLQIALVAPTIFTANQNGHGVPAATVVRVRANGQQVTETPTTFIDGHHIARPLDLGPEGERLILVLFLTGLRNTPNNDGNNNNGSAENVRVLIGGLQQTPLFAGAQPSFAGLDQINVEIPRALLDPTQPGSRQINVLVKVPGFADSNETEIAIAPAVGSALAINGLTAVTPALVNSEVRINGSGISPIIGNNKVSFGEGAGDARPGEIRAATETQLTVLVPFGAASGRITLNSGGKIWTSEQMFPVRTSLSALVLDTDGQPISSLIGARVCHPNCERGNLSATIQPGGWFVLPDMPPSPRQLFVIEVPAQAGSLSYNRTTISSPIIADRDNHLPQQVYLQAIFGPSGIIGNPGTLAQAADTPGQAHDVTDAPELDLRIDGFSFGVRANTSATFPGGATSGRVTLTPVKNSLTPVPLPRGVFSSAIAQVSPFGVTLASGGRFTFPNRDGLRAFPQPTLYKYDVGEATFVNTGIRAELSSDGQSFVTPEGAITETSIYFLAVPQQSTTIVGRVLESDGQTPIRGAVVTARGRNAVTDGNGGYNLTEVPTGDIDEGELTSANRATQRFKGDSARSEAITVTASYLRPSGRTDTVSQTVQNPVIDGITHVPPLMLPPAVANRPPTINVAGYITSYATETRQVPVTITDLDANQTISSATVSGAAFASLQNQGTGNYTLQLVPKAADVGTHTLTVMATDSAGGSSSVAVTVVVYAAPTAQAQTVMTSAGTPVNITLGGSDAGNASLTYLIVTQPAHGSLSGAAPTVTYTPVAGYTGGDSFTFKVSNGAVESAPATVTITITNPIPILSSLQPNSTAVGQPIEIQVAGQKFMPGSVVRFKGEARPTTYLGPTMLKVQILAGDVSQAGTAMLTVFNPAPGGGESAGLTFTISNPVPTIASLSPNSTEAQGPGFTLTVNGSGFVQGSIVHWNKNLRQTTFQNTTTLQASIPASDIATPGIATVNVVNPGPGGGFSASADFTIVSSGPTLTSFTHSMPAHAFLFQQVLVGLTGTNFTPSSIVRWDGVDLPAVFKNSTSITFSAPIIHLSEALNSHTIAVFNPGTGGGLSNSLSGFQIPNNQPTINSVSPDSITQGAAAPVNLTITGSFFTPGSVVNWNGSQRQAIVSSPSNLTFSISGSEINGKSPATITVFNPPPFSMASASFSYNIHPLPTISSISPMSITLLTPGPDEVTVNGNFFLSTSTILFNGSPTTIKFISSSQVSFPLPKFADDAAGVYSVAVTNPLPSGTSTGPSFTVNNPLPLISSLNPSMATAGGPAFTLNVIGQKFVPSSIVRWNGSDRPTTYISQGQLQAAIPASDIAVASQVKVWVFSPGPGGGSSPSSDFNITGSKFTSLAHRGPTVAILANGDVIAAGGLEAANQEPTARVEIYRPATDSWQIGLSMLSARTAHTATILTTGDVLSIGGLGLKDQILSSAEIYDSTTGVWRRTSDSGFAHLAHTVTLLADGRVLVTGGRDESGAISGRAEIYDPTADKWMSIDPLKTPRAEATALLLADGRVLVAGGVGESGDLASAEIYDPQTGQWTPTGDLHFIRAEQTMTRLADGRVLIVGGSDKSAAATSEIYDPSKGAWEASGQLITARSAHSALLLADGRVLITGGRSSDGRLLRECEIYDPRNNAWSEAAALGEARERHMTIILNNGLNNRLNDWRVVAVGGRGER